MELTSVVNFAALLRRYRLAAGLSQEALAERAGLSTRAISDLERGLHRAPYRETIRQLVDALGLHGSDRAALAGAAEHRRSPRVERLIPFGELPVPLTPLIGREREVAAATRLLRRADVRLVTFTGPGGSGKTRLAVEVAADLAGEFADGAVFVDLAPLTNPDLVPAALARALGLEGASNVSLLERLAAVLRTRSLLLVLDNFEHLMPAAELIPQLLQGAAHVSALITSRAPLRVRGEHQFPVGPLSYPDAADAAPETLAQFPAVALFTERALEARPDFALTAANAAAVVTICARMDGLPLALELAAARIRHLSVEAIAARLDARLALLTGGPRDVPARQRTLRDTIAWSHDLLSPAEQLLFRRLAVFAGGCSLDAAPAVCDLSVDVTLPPLDSLASLVDSGLVQQRDGPEGEPRFAMLETVREYALERLAESGEAQAVRRAHAEFFVALVETINPHLYRAGWITWLRHLDADRDNLRAIRAWSRAETDGGMAALRLVGVLWRYWHWSGALDEGRRATTEALAQPAARSTLRARGAALLAAGFLARECRDLAAARPLVEECVALSPEVNDPQVHAHALALLALLLLGTGELDEARRLALDSIDLSRRLDFAFGLVWANAVLAGACLRSGDPATARVHADEALRWAGDAGIEPVGLETQAWVDAMEGRYDQAQTRRLALLAIAREQEHSFVIADTLTNLASIALHQGDLREAETFLEESIERFRRMGGDTSAPLSNLAWVLLRKGGSPQRARVLLAEALTEARRRGAPGTVIACLGGLARVAAVMGDAPRAARLLGAAEAWRDAHAGLTFETRRAEIDQTMVDARERLGGSAFTAAYTEGRAHSLDDAIARALEQAD